MVNCINLIIEMSPRFILGRENVSCVAEVVNRSLKADCTNYTMSRGELPLRGDEPRTFTKGLKRIGTNQGVATSQLGGTRIHAMHAGGRFGTSVE